MLIHLMYACMLSGKNSNKTEKENHLQLATSHEKRVRLHRVPECDVTKK